MFTAMKFKDTHKFCCIIIYLFLPEVSERTEIEELKAEGLSKCHKGLSSRASNSD